MVYNGAAPEEFAKFGEKSWSEKYRRILFVGRVVPDKGLHILIDAFNGLIEELPHAELAIVGPLSDIPRSSPAIHASKEAMVKEIEAKFGDLKVKGEFRCCEALPVERDEPSLAHLHRLVFAFNRRDHGRLRMLIDLINREE